MIRVTHRWKCRETQNFDIISTNYIHLDHFDNFACLQSNGSLSENTKKKYFNRVCHQAFSSVFKSTGANIDVFCIIV